MVSYTESILEPFTLISTTSITLKLASLALISPDTIAFPDTCNFSVGAAIPIPTLPVPVMIRWSDAPYPNLNLFSILEPFL